MKIRLIGIRNIASAFGPFLVFAVLLGIAQAQNSVKAASKAPSPELVGDLTKQLSITPTQATGGAGALFGLAKSRLGAAALATFAAVVPGMNGFLKAAPPAGD